MRTENQIAELGRKLIALRARYQQTSPDDTKAVAALDKELAALGEEMGEDEEWVLDWIDEQQRLLDMTRGGGVFDAAGHYIPITYRHTHE